jgi:hypothetical protein
MAIGVRRDEEFSGTKPVEEHHRFDEARLYVRNYPATHNG